MSQTQSAAGYPSSASSSTLTIRFRGRQTEGVGPMTGTIPASHGLSDLAVGFLAGWENAATHDQVVDLIVSYVANSSLAAWWNPVSGTPEQLLRDALAKRIGASPTTLNVLFDGQYGPVFAT